MRLPKPIATGVRFQSRALGSVYTAAQMKAYAAKAVESEREACAKVCEDIEMRNTRQGPADCAVAIRARGGK
jgi:hypothetical protein